MLEDRYHRHHLLSEIGVVGQKRLRAASVLIVGVGGLGSPIALYLAAAGIGRIGLIDDDIVSITNLQRQVLYREHQLGHSKVQCAAHTLSQLNSQTIIESHPYRLTADNALRLISDYDIVVDGCDNHATRYLIDDCCRQLNKPYIYGSIGEFHGQVSVFHYRKGRGYADLYPDREELSALPQQTLGVMGVVPGIIGTIQAAEAVKIITKSGTPLDGRLLLLNVLDMEMNIVSIV